MYRYTVVFNESGNIVIEIGGHFIIRILLPRDELRPVYGERMRSGRPAC